MTITQFDLESLQKACEHMTDLIKEIKHSKDYEKLFNSRADFEQAKMDKMFIPEKFYFFRLFNIECHISYNARIKKYMIVLKNIYSNVLDRFKNNQRNQDTFIINESLDYTLDVWKDVIEDVLTLQVKTNGLF